MKIQILAPCEKVIQDGNSGPSLISTFQEITAQIPQGAELPPENAVMPKDWTLFSLWGVTDEDVGKILELHMEVYWPNGELFIEQKINVKAEKPDWVSFTVRMLGFPMGQRGKLQIRVWIESEGQKISEVAETAILVKLLVAQEPA